MDSSTRHLQPPGIFTRLVVLLAVAIFIDYVDRSNVAAAAPPLKSGLGLTNTQLGRLRSACYWTYAPMHLLAGTQSLAPSRLRSELPPNKSNKRCRPPMRAFGIHGL